MALKKCKVCGNGVSSTAQFCPNCGNNIINHTYKVLNSTKVLSFFFPFIGFNIYAFNIGKNDKLAKEGCKYALTGILTVIIICIFLYLIFTNQTETISGTPDVSYNKQW